MKKVLSVASVSVCSIALFFLSGCYQSEITSETCNGDYKITELFWAFQGSSKTWTIYAPNGASVFPEDITVTLDFRDREKTYQVKANDPSPKELFATFDPYDLNTVSITSPSCPNPITKTDDDVKRDTEALCSGQVEIVATTCESIVKIAWESAQSLTGISLNVYGKTIALGSASSITFDKSNLDLTKNQPSLSNAGQLCLLFEAIGCTGNTGTLAISETIAAGQDLSITVTDADLNTSEVSPENVVVTVTTSKGETEDITLTETGINTAIFSATLPTVLGSDAGTNHDGSLVIENSTTITVTYDDQLDGNLNDPTPVIKSVTATGPSAQEEEVVTYNGVTYYLTPGTYQPLEIETPFKTWFTLTNEDNTLTIEIVVSYTTNSLTDGTYTVGGTDKVVVSQMSSVTVGTDGTQSKEFSSGTVVVTVEEDGYRLEMNLQTSVGTLKGISVVAF